MSAERVPAVEEGRTITAALVLIPVAGLIGSAFNTGGAGRWLCLAIGLLAPVTGIAAAKAIGTASPADAFAIGQWERWMPDWHDWLTQKDIVAACRPWCWATPYAILPLMALGLWRAFSRGFRQRRAGEAPLGWLVFLTSLVVLAVLVPSSGPTHGSPTLLWLTVLLSVYAVADLGLFLFEQLKLPPPHT